MKLVTAVIRPTVFEAVRDALEEVGVRGLTVTEVQGRGRQKGHTEVYRGTTFAVDLLPKLRLEVLVSSAQVDAVTRALLDAARTGGPAGEGLIGDGKVWVSPVDDVIRVRTGERGETAL